MKDKIVKSDAEWQAQLSSPQYAVCRKKGTEPAFSGAYDQHAQAGIYTCVCCGQELFSSEAKFSSGSGWPSFHSPIAPKQVDRRSDHSLGMIRTEVTCALCASHLGHVFEDGPAPTGLRYCINSLSLDFMPKKDDQS